MEIWSSIIEYDKQLLLYLHSQGNPFWDSFWLFITTPINWIPLFILIFYLGFRKFKLKKALLISLFTAISAALALGVVNLIKNSVERLRPINDLSINKAIPVLIEHTDFSFVSGHSTVSFTIAFISFWLLKKYYKWMWLVFLFPILFAYSRIYLAAHFPIDITVGMLLGYLIAKVFYVLIIKVVFRRDF
ncbi:phosphatase PAP2 family protein [Lutibacter sp. TH_r2]|uniref:phosphatase PAP2 family protein n=1 Tax=Lutibacter sp. TH_r2 TaxID=3082083 RepID=UPI002952FE9F|nr:phosphatase PAP2 family protein [Lutibacter sp. TH_r2]MDV7186342.1 phosphatase PAP2 family protein [Lutibacter sp. TH_r2]